MISSSRASGCVLRVLALLGLVASAFSCCNISPEMQSALDLHNTLRAKHGCGPLTWDATVAASAQAWADRGKFEHSFGKYGENIAMGQDTASQATQDFYNEGAGYDYSRPGFSPEGGAMETGHFSQLVWCGSQRLGIAKGAAGGSALGTSERKPFYVFQYDPPGNVETQFEANVLPEGSSSSYASASASASASSDSTSASASASANAAASATADASASANAAASATADASASANAAASATADASASASANAAASATAQASASANAAASPDDFNGWANLFSSAFAPASTDQNVPASDTSQDAGDTSQTQQAGTDSQWQPTSGSDQSTSNWEVPDQSGRRLARRLLGSFHTSNSQRH